MFQFCTGLVRRQSEKAGDYEKVFGMFEGTDEPPVILCGPLDWPASRSLLRPVPIQLTLHLLGFHSFYVAPQVQLGS